MKRLLLAVFTIFTLSVTAQEAKKVWTLKECVDYALANSLLVKRGALNVESSEIDNTQARFSLLPTANATGSFGYNWGRGLDPVSNQFISSQRNNVSSMGLNGSWTLFNGLRIQNSIKQTSRSLDATEEDLTKAKNDVSLNIITLFVNVVLNRELVENSRFQLTTSQNQLEQTTKRVAAGGLPRVDQLNIEAQVATNELTLINQENALALSLLQLKQAMQIPASEELEIETPQIAPEDLVLDQTRDEIFEMAKASMPEIKSSKLKIESSYYGVKAARGNLYPRLSLNGSINSNYSKNSETVFVRDGGSFTDPDPIAITQSSDLVYALRPTGTYEDSYFFEDQIKDNLYKSVGLSLTIPIFNNYASKASLQRSIITNEQAKISAKEVENTLRQNVETAFNDALAASKTFSSSTKQVTAREEAFRATQQRYDNGATNFVDYQTSENNLYQAKTDLARAKYNFIFKKKLLDFYQGKDLGL